MDCIYCGDLAEVRDHVIPYSYNSDIRRRKRSTRYYSVREVVPACKECNVLLSNKFLPTIAERAAYLKVRIAERYKKYLHRPGFHWIWFKLGHLDAVATKTKLTPETYWAMNGVPIIQPRALGRRATGI